MHTHAAPFAALIGIDWADAHHDIALLDCGSGAVEHSRLTHTPKAIVEWASRLRRRFGGRPVGVALEQSRGPLVYALLEHDFLVLYPVSPAQLKSFRETFASSGAKSDPTDAELALELLTKHRDRLRPWRPDDPETRALRRLVEARRKAVDQRTRFVQRLRAELKAYFPQVLGWVSDLSNPLALDLLRKWPSLEALQRARPHTIRTFYYGHNCRHADLVEERIEAIQAARPLTTDPALIETAALTVEMLVGQLRPLAHSIARYEEEIERRFQAHPDAELFSCLPGSGAALAPRLLTAFGTDRSRFRSALELQQYSGAAPVTKQSGNKRVVQWRWSAPTFVRQSFHEFANQSIQQSAWARAYYEVQKERGKGHHAAVRALAFKWIRILWRCWQDRTPYDESRYLKALRRRGSPLAERLGRVAPVAA